MTIIKEVDLYNFDAWSGAKDTKVKIINDGFAEQFNNLISELYPDGLTETELNDILWFEDEWIYSTLGISNEE